MEKNRSKLDRSTEMLDLAIRLNARLSSPLKSIKIFPIEQTGKCSWIAKDYNNLGQQKLNEVLGKLAMHFIRAELMNTLLVTQYQFKSGELKISRPEGANDAIPRLPSFRIGLATGSTIHKLVETWEPIGSPREIEVFPLVIGPVPETRYSAGFIASLLQSRIEDETRERHPDEPSSKGYKLVDYKYAVGKDDPRIEMRLSKTFKDLRDLENSPGVPPLAEWLDWVITGIGGIGYGQCHEHQLQIFGGEIEGAIGDVCSRYFGENGLELGGTVQKKSDCYSAINFETMQAMCKTHGKGKRVIAIAGGKQKYPAILSLLRRKSLLFNCFVTDELTARRLLMEL